MTDDITAFIRARLDEVEARVHAGIEWWFSTECVIWATDAAGLTVAGADDYIRPFIDPSRVLRGVKATRSVLAVARWLEDSGRTLAASEVRRALASEHSTHPDYRPEWTL